MTSEIANPHFLSSALAALVNQEKIRAADARSKANAYTGRDAKEKQELSEQADQAAGFRDGFISVAAPYID